MSHVNDSQHKDKNFKHVASIWDQNWFLFGNLFFGFEIFKNKAFCISKRYIIGDGVYTTRPNRPLWPWQVAPEWWIQKRLFISFWDADDFKFFSLDHYIYNVFSWNNMRDEQGVYDRDKKSNRLENNFDPLMSLSCDYIFEFKSDYMWLHFWYQKSHDIVCFT